jgi:cation-transporting ATPase E
MTVLAAIGSTGYNIMLFIHIIAVVVAFAPLWLTPVLLRLTAAGDKAAADGLEVSILRFSLPGLAVAGIVGCGLVGMSEKAFTFGKPWVSIAVILWIVLMVVLAVVARPYELWRVALVVGAALGYLVIFAIPLAREKFMLDPSNPEVTGPAVLIGLLAAALIEASWWIQGRVLGEPRLLWRRADYGA